MPLGIFLPRFRVSFVCPSNFPLQSLCNKRASALQARRKGATTDSLNRNLPAFLSRLESLLYGLIRRNLIIKKRRANVGRENLRAPMPSSLIARFFNSVGDRRQPHFA